MAAPGAFKRVVFLASRGRGFATSSNVQKHVTILGQTGRIGEVLPDLMRVSPLVTTLNLYDCTIGQPKNGPVNCDEVAIRLQHCESPGELLEGSDLVVIIPTGDPPRLGLSEEDKFNINASIVSKHATDVAEFCPEALVAVISNPVNSMVPIVSEILKQWNVYDPRKVFGVTSFNTAMAGFMVGAMAGVPFDAMARPTVRCPVIGGNSGTSIIPVFSQCPEAKSLSVEQRKELTRQIRNDYDYLDDNVMAIAFAASRFCDSLLRGLDGEKDVVECAYVRTDITGEDERNIAKVTGTNYFATQVVLGKEGLHKNMGLGMLNKDEELYLPEAIRKIKLDIQRGEAYVKTGGEAKLRAEAKLRGKWMDEMEKGNWTWRGF